MQPLFWSSIVLAMFAVSCTTSHSDMAQQPLVAERPVVRCAGLDGQPQSDPCSAKTMAGQRVRR